MTGPERTATRRNPGGTLYVVHVVPGLESLAQQEIARVLPGSGIERVLTRFDERTSVLLVRYAGAPRDLLDLKLAEDVFTLAMESEAIQGGWHGLTELRTLISSSSSLPPAIDAALKLRARRRGKVTFRVVARKAGSQAFRRVDLQHAVERAMIERFPSWRLVEDDAQLEIWIHLVGRSLIMGIRLSDITMRQRTYRQESLPAALKPTVAHAMVQLSKPHDDDVFLDPMCGSGTILIERAEAGRYTLLLGGDADGKAVAATRANVGPRYKPIEIRRWDARQLPLGNRSVSAIVTNLPFGKQVGTPAEIRPLYPALLKEWTRVLEESGRMVLLTGDRALLARAVKRHPELVQEQTFTVLVRGYVATIFVVHMRRSP